MEGKTKGRSTATLPLSEFGSNELPTQRYATILRHDRCLVACSKSPNPRHPATLRRSDDDTEPILQAWKCYWRTMRALDTRCPACSIIRATSSSGRIDYYAEQPERWTICRALTLDYSSLLLIVAAESLPRGSRRSIRRWLFVLLQLPLGSPAGSSPRDKKLGLYCKFWSECRIVQPKCRRGCPPMSLSHTTYS